MFCLDLRSTAVEDCHDKAERVSCLHTQHLLQMIELLFVADNDAVIFLQPVTSIEDEEERLLSFLFVFVDFPQ